MGRPITFLMNDTIPRAETLVMATSVLLKSRGQTANWPAIVDELVHAIAYSLFSGMPDPSDGEVLEEALGQIKEMIGEGVRKAVKEMGHMA